jgi:hypothetical protein
MAWYSVFSFTYIYVWLSESSPLNWTEAEKLRTGHPCILTRLSRYNVKSRRSTGHLHVPLLCCTFLWRSKAFDFYKIPRKYAVSVESKHLSCVEKWLHEFCTQQLKLPTSEGKVFHQMLQHMTRFVTSFSWVTESGWREGSRRIWGCEIDKKCSVTHCKSFSILRKPPLSRITKSMKIFWTFHFFHYGAKREYMRFW